GARTQVDPDLITAGITRIGNICSRIGVAGIGIPAHDQSFITDQPEPIIGVRRNNLGIGRHTIIIAYLIHLASAVITLVDIKVYADLQRVAGFYRPSNRLFTKIDVAIAPFEHSRGLRMRKAAKEKDE